MKRIILAVFSILLLSSLVSAFECKGTTFTVLSDSRQEYDAYKVTLQTIKPYNPIFAVYPGDMDMIPINSKLHEDILGIPAYWAVGNHELSPGNVEALQDLNKAQPNIINWFDAKDNYFDNTMFSFDYQNLHFIVLDEYLDTREGNIKYGSETYNWLKKDLESVKDKNNTRIYVAAHEPAYPNERHIGNSLDMFPEDRDNFLKLLSDNSVDIIFFGHTHHYIKIEEQGVTQINDGHSTRSAIIGCALKDRTEITVLEIIDGKYKVTNQYSIMEEKEKEDKKLDSPGGGSSHIEPTAIGSGNIIQEKKIETKERLSLWQRILRLFRI